MLKRKEMLYSMRMHTLFMCAQLRSLPCVVTNVSLDSMGIFYNDQGQSLLG